MCTLTPLAVRVAIVGILTIAFAIVYHKKIKGNRGVLLKNIQQTFDRDFSKSFKSQLKWLVLSILAVFMMLLAGSWLFHPLLGDSFGSRIWNLTGHFLNPGSFNKGGDGNSNVWVLFTNLMGMVFLGGLLISVFNNILERRVEKVRNGRVYYPFKKHTVIIGYDKMSIGLVKQLAAKYPHSEIVLQTIQEVPEVRHELFSNLMSGIEKKVTLVSGNRTSTEDLQKLHIDNCTEVFILGEKEEYDNDSLNIECLLKIHALLTTGKPPLRCNVLFEYQSTFTVFQQQDIDEIKDRIDFVPFSYYETWAQKVFVNLKYEIRKKDAIEYTPLDHQPITADSDKGVHLVVIGMSRMGVAMGIQAAHLCHFPNFVTKGIKTRITFIDDNADREMNFLKGRYKHLFKEVDYAYRNIDDESLNFDNAVSKEKFTDIAFQFVKGRVENPKIQEYIAGLSTDKNIYLTIAVCFSFPPQSIAAGLYLPDEVYARQVPVLVRQEISYCTLAMLSAKKEGAGYRKYSNVKPFGMLDNCYDLEKADDLLPMMVKYVYDHTRTENKEKGEENIVLKEFPEEDIKKNWAKEWKKDDNISALKWSNRYNANTIYIKQRSLDIQPGKELTPEQINLLAPVEHNRWVIEKLLMGYRAPAPEEAGDITHGKKKEYSKRLIHNDIRAYRYLSKDDKGICADQYDINISQALPFMLKGCTNNNK
jgi:hypothetical protein